MVAREVLATDPRVLRDLDTVRLGTSFFRRWLERLPDDQFDGPTVLPGWTCRTLVSHVGYNARAVARLVTWADTGVENPMYSSPEARGAEIESGASLRPDALRSLVEHAAVELDVRWRDLPADRWDFEVRTAQGRLVPVSETLWMRSREVWLHAVDLGTGARVSDVPPEVLARLLRDVVGMWDKRGELDGLAVRTEDAAGTALVLGEAEPTSTVSGPLPAVVAWATGRDLAPETLTWAGGVRRAPRWL